MSVLWEIYEIPVCSCHTPTATATRQSTKLFVRRNNYLAKKPTLMMSCFNKLPK